MECGVRSEKWGVWSVECGSVECGVQSAECVECGEWGVWSVECGVRSGAWGVGGSAECGVRRAECGVGSVERGVWSGECGVWSAEWRMNERMNE